MWARRAVPLLVAAVMLVGCAPGSTGSRADPAGPSGPEAIALAPYAQRFAPIVAPIEVAGATFESGSGALRTGATVNEFLLVAGPFAEAVARADVELRQVVWPAVALHDIKAELAADTSLRAELLGTLDDTLLMPVWRQQALSAARRANDARRRVGIDLGLSPPSG